MWSGLDWSSLKKGKIGWKSLGGHSICEQAGAGGLPIIKYIEPSTTETVDPRLLAEQGKKELMVKRM